MHHRALVCGIAKGKGEAVWQREREGTVQTWVRLGTGVA